MARSCWMGKILLLTTSTTGPMQGSALHSSSRQDSGNDGRQAAFPGSRRELSEPECCKMLSGVGLCAKEYIKREV